MYAAPISRWAYFVQADTVFCEAHENYQKGSLRNKLLIGTSQGPKQISVPLQRGKHQQLDIQSVKIDYGQSWITQHLRSVQTAYGASPYFEHYFDGLTEFYSQQYDTLWELNVMMSNKIKNWIGWAGKMELTSEFHRKYPNDFSDLRALKKDRYQLPEYPQVHESVVGFMSDLSILDLVFHLGPESLFYLKNINLKSLQIVKS